MNKGDITVYDNIANLYIAGCICGVNNLPMTQNLRWQLTQIVYSHFVCFLEVAFNTF